MEKLNIGDELKEICEYCGAEYFNEEWEERKRNGKIDWSLCPWCGIGGENEILYQL